MKGSTMSDPHPQYLHVKVSINGNELNTYCFEDTNVNIGRGSDCQVVLDNPGISRVHAILQREGENVRVIDQESGNGTFVNGNTVGEAWVRSSDTLRIGKFTLSVRVSILKGDVEPPAEPEDDDLASPVDVEDKTVSLSAGDRKKILQQAQSMRANAAKPAASSETATGFRGIPFALLFVGGTLFGLFVSWLFGG